MRKVVKAWAIRIGSFEDSLPYYMHNKIFDKRKDARQYIADIKHPYNNYFIVKIREIPKKRKRR